MSTNNLAPLYYSQGPNQPPLLINVKKKPDPPFIKFSKYENNILKKPKNKPSLLPNTSTLFLLNTLFILFLQGNYFY